MSVVIMMDLLSPDESVWRELKPGVHTIGNGDLDAADDPRVQRTQKL